MYKYSSSYVFSVSEMESSFALVSVYTLILYVHLLVCHENIDSTTTDSMIIATALI